MIIIEILLFIFVIAVVALVLYAYYPIIIKKQNKNTEKIIKNYLNILKSESDVEKLSSAFIGLLRESYVLIHVMVNKGNNYKDDVQCKLFCEYLNSSEIVKEIKSLEDNNGKYTL